MKLCVYLCEGWSTNSPGKCTNYVVTTPPRVFASRGAAHSWVTETLEERLALYRIAYTGLRFVREEYCGNEHDYHASYINLLTTQPDMPTRVARYGYSLSAVEVPDLTLLAGAAE